MKKNTHQKTVHVVFKTHLDIGFTDLSSNVFRQYMEDFIPRAIALAEQARKKGLDDKFIWTTGSWLIYEYLEKASTANRKKMEKAILTGDIAWHGLPFTTHTELMDESLFRAGLHISKELDRRFGKKTIAAKMTDVPGHCRAIIPLLAEAGIKFLHIGVNESSKPVDFPSLFVWRSPCGSEVAVNYVSGYGKTAELEGFNEILTFAHSNDNCGPPSGIEELGRIYAHIRQSFRNAEVRASTLDNYGGKLVQMMDRLPVITKEPGDTWIHGAGTDPLKVSQFRQLCRLRNMWEKDYKLDLSNREYFDFSRSLMRIPEHTWGMDLKTHLRDYANYPIKDFAKARKAGLVDEEKNSRVNPFSIIKVGKDFVQLPEKELPPADYRIFEKSWKEQRDYITESVDCLKTAKLKNEAIKTLEEVRPGRISTKGFRKLEKTGKVKAGSLTVMFNDRTGTIKSITEGRSGRNYILKGGPGFGLFRQEIFSASCYKNFYDRYNIEKPATWFWSIPDFTKPGLDKVKNLKHEFFTPAVKGIYERCVSGCTEVLFVLAMPEKSVRVYGAPKEIQTLYSIPEAGGDLEVQCRWSGKKANRIPEAFWFSFCPSVKKPDKWLMNKMGEPISPLEVIHNGNRALHALWSSVFYEQPDASIEIESLDAPLVSPGRPRILEFDTEQPDLREGFHFNLFNNLWGTNFPMWYEDDALFRFVIRLQ